MICRTGLQAPSQFSIKQSDGPGDPSYELTSTTHLLTTHLPHPMPYFRPEILAMAGYTPGEQPQAGKFIKLNTNENPYPPSPAVLRAIEETAKQGLVKYPDPMATAFRVKAAELFGVEPNWILCGNGSDDILTITTRALVGQGQLLRLPYPSYILYKTLAELQGARSEEIRFNPDWSLPASFSAAKSRLAARLPAEPQQPDWHHDFKGKDPGNRGPTPLPFVG